MAISKQKKEEILDKVRGITKKSPTIVFAQFNKFTVAQVNEMRKGLHAKEVGYTVAKKTLIKRALDEIKPEGVAPELAGEIAIAYSYGDDVLTPARELSVFVKKFSEQLSFAGGVFGGRYVGAVEMAVIANIPPIEILRAQFVQVINSPIQKLVIALGQIAEKKEAVVA